MFVKGEGWLESLPNWALLLALFVFYVVTYTITFFFQAAIIAGASERMAGGDPTLGSALGAAGKPWQHHRRTVEGRPVTDAAALEERTRREDARVEP